MMVLAGLLTTRVGLGGLMSWLGLPLANVLPWLVPVIDGLLIGLGVVLVTGRNPFARLGTISVPAIGHPVGQAYAYGLFLGPLALPCAGPFLPALLAISVGVVDALGRIATFAAYGLGFGFPLVALSLIAAAGGRTASRLPGPTQGNRAKRMNPTPISDGIRASVAQAGDRVQPSCTNCAMVRQIRNAGAAKAPAAAKESSEASGGAHRFPIGRRAGAEVISAHKPMMPKPYTRVRAKPKYPSISWK